MGDQEYLVIFYSIVLPVIQEFSPDYLFVSAGEAQNHLLSQALSRLWLGLWRSCRQLPGHSWGLWLDDESEYQAINLYYAVKIILQELNKLMGGKNLILALEGKLQSLTKFLLRYEPFYKVDTTLRHWGPALSSAPRPYLATSLRSPGDCFETPR